MSAESIDQRKRDYSTVSWKTPLQSTGQPLPTRTADAEELPDESGLSDREHPVLTRACHHTRKEAAILYSGLLGGGSYFSRRAGQGFRPTSLDGIWRRLRFVLCSGVGAVAYVPEHDP